MLTNKYVYKHHEKDKKNKKIGPISKAYCCILKRDFQTVTFISK